MRDFGRLKRSAPCLMRKRRAAILESMTGVRGAGSHPPPLVCLYSATPEGLPELPCYEYSTSIETNLRIPLSPGQSSSPIFGLSFYSLKRTLTHLPAWVDTLQV